MPKTRGRTTIDDSVVAKIASLAVGEIDDVAALGGSLAGRAGQIVPRARRGAGLGVDVGETEAAVDVAVQVRYPAAIDDVARQVRENVISRFESLTGLSVVEVNVAVTDLVFPGGEEEAAEQPPPRVE